ncbi:hypothetical protein F5887DRAFT_1286503 [Amanita rubescens]|nr:hypothetical protein F5887DRAFT_1286503 [Amanita rubescens]
MTSAYSDITLEQMPPLANMANTTLDTGFIIGLSVAYAFVVIFTCFRLASRATTKNLWWHDFWAMISLSLLVFQGISTAVIVSNPQGLIIRQENTKKWILLYQAISIASIWSARLSLGVVVVRLFPPEGGMLLAHLICKLVVVLFGIATICLVLYRTMGCWFQVHSVNKIELCGFNTTVTAALEMLCGTAADLWLVNAITYRIHSIKLTKQYPRIRTLTTVSITSILAASCVSITYSVLVLLQQSKASFIARCVQCAAWLFVCNLPMLVARLYQYLKTRETTEKTTSREEWRTRRVIEHWHAATFPCEPEDHPPACYCQPLMPMACNLAPTSTFPSLQMYHCPLDGSEDERRFASSPHTQTENDDSIIIFVFGSDNVDLDKRIEIETA